MNHLQTRVRQQFDQLTASQQKLARLFLLEPKRFALHTAKEIGEWSGTSESTAFRFGQALGFRGYSDLQAYVQQALLNQTQTSMGTATAMVTMSNQEEGSLPSVATSCVSNDFPAPASSDHTYLPTSTGGHAMTRMIELEMQADLEAIRRTSQLNLEAIVQAAKLIGRSSHVVIVGLKASYAPAHWLAYALNLLHGHVSLYRGGVEDGNSLLTQVDADSLVIGLSFPRYMRETWAFMQQAQRRSARLLAITDHALSPIGRLADQVLQIEAPHPIPLKGMSALFSLLHLLTSALSQLEPEQTHARMEAYQQADTLYHYVSDE